MKPEKQGKTRYRVSAAEAFKLVFRHARKRILEQIRAIALIIIYMVLFQVLVLNIPLVDSGLIAFGFVLVVFGLAFFMEGLLLGLMPLGEVIGIRMPLKASMATILIIGFILGIGATFAEPSIGALRMAGQSIKAWNSPLLFLLLNKFAAYLVYAIGIGVGLAVVFGMLRFLYGWSLKPFIFFSVPFLLFISFFAYIKPNLNQLLGLAWDCGAVTTGPVTVPLILALGLGISHVSRRGGKDTGGGFGVVTLASLFPIFAVLMIGFALSGKVQAPMSEKQFFSVENRENTLFLFESEDAMKGYALGYSSRASYLPLFDNDEAQLDEFKSRLISDNALREKVFRSQNEFEHWLINQDDHELKLKYFGSEEQLFDAIYKGGGAGADVMEILKDFRRHSANAAQAIVPLSLFLILVMFLVLRERLPRADEIFLGLFFAFLGMVLFSGGIELGLGKIGDQVGANLPASYTKIEMPSERMVIREFDPDIVNVAIGDDGKAKPFFYYEHKEKLYRVPFEEKCFNAELRQYEYIPSRGPLFGVGERTKAGLFVVLLFAFIMGYGATLAEPALNALGMAVEDITVGTFKKSLLIQSVAVGVGFGIAIGLAKIIWGLPLFWMLLVPYMLLMIFTKLSSEEFVNIGWDSAGVTTGPITVPLVLALGLGIGTQVGAAEGFGILSMASVCPIISVLSVGLVVNHKRKAALKALEADESRKAEEVAA
ncbi:MAG TPA: DUF1538 family protein [Candidatus Cloacimonetes bacterium]|nr:DUF1538 family protein [Candidatus Cloacimonadota bacterium]